MTEHNLPKSEKTETTKRVFVSHARVLPQDQRQSLTESEIEFEKSCEDRGVWLELFCPDDMSFSEEERFQVPVFCEDPKAEKKLWLKLFCPDNSCEITSPTQLP